jgi:CBS domain-containing protein
MAAGLPTEGSNTATTRAGNLARRDVPTCRLDERLGDVRERAQTAGWNAAVVVTDERVVLGLLRQRKLDGEADTRVEVAMLPGPKTFRPYASAKEMADFLTEHDMENVPITTSDGRLVGLVLREDAVRAAGA